VDAKTVINSIGLILNLVGIWMVYVNSPINFHTIDGGDADQDFTKIEKETNTRNGRLRIGVKIVIAGTMLQLISNFIPSKN
jgi:hypothetical protein